MIQHTKTLGTSLKIEKTTVVGTSLPEIRLASTNVRDRVGVL